MVLHYTTITRHTGKWWTIPAVDRPSATASVDRDNPPKRYNAPVPPLELQRRFTTIIDSIEKQKVKLHAYLAESDTFFTSLQHRAFRGEL